MGGVYSTRTLFPLTVMRASGVAVEGSSRATMPLAVFQLSLVTNPSWDPPIDD